MAPRANNSPLLGYNTNVRHGGHLFHIQTEDSGRDHPHIITHLFTEGTILASRKKSYTEFLEDDHWEDIVRQLMKDQHKTMFVELRDGVHDEIAEKILGKSLSRDIGEAAAASGSSSASASADSSEDSAMSDSQVFAVAPAAMDAPAGARTVIVQPSSRGKSIFDAPDTSGNFGESLISDKSLDEVILSYLTDELQE
jgi:hypothetical protein